LLLREVTDWIEKNEGAFPVIDIVLSLFVVLGVMVYATMELSAAYLKFM